jgi:hypothetical protein
MIEIERIDDVGKRGMHVHDVADDHRRALMTAQNRGRERPCGRDRLDVVGIDLRERRIARVGVIACRLRPVFVGADRPSVVGGSNISVRSVDRQAA